MFTSLSMSQEERKLKRQWFSAHDPPLSAISVQSWNILAQSYVRHELFPQSPRPLLKWKRRGAAIVEALSTPPRARNAPPDILCLQEVDRFDGFYRGVLRRLGYHVLVYKPRPGTKRDGSLVAARGRFVIMETDHLDFNALCDEAPCVTELARLRHIARVDSAAGPTDYFMRDCVAAVCVLYDTDSHVSLLVASAHLYWDPACTDVKVMQAFALLRHIDAVAARHDNITAIVLAADLNAEPNSAVMRLLTTGRLDGEHKDCYNIPRDVVEYVNNELSMCTHVPSLASAYGYNENQPGASNRPELEAISTLTHKFHGVIDHIMFRSFVKPLPGSHTMDVVKDRLELPTVRECRKAGISGFPSEGCPSDHLPLVAFFDFE